MRAFTLIEILVVVIIIAVMAGVVVPAYSRMSTKIKFDGVVGDVKDILRYARAQAVERDTTVTVSYDPQSGTFAARALPTLPATDLPVALSSEANVDSDPSPLAAEAPRTVSLDRGYSVGSFSLDTGNANPGSTGQRAIRFRGDGTSDAAEITLIATSGDAAVLRLMPATGSVVVKDPNAERRSGR
jgi:prepilin-type N-terminal cleavage/methylation domain-containing protein